MESCRHFHTTKKGKRSIKAILQMANDGKRLFRQTIKLNGQQNRSSCSNCKLTFKKKERKYSVYLQKKLAQKFFKTTKVKCYNYHNENTNHRLFVQTTKGGKKILI